MCLLQNLKLFETRDEADKYHVDNFLRLVSRFTLWELSNVSISSESSDNTVASWTFYDIHSNIPVPCTRLYRSFVGCSSYSYVVNFVCPLSLPNETTLVGHNGYRIWLGIFFLLGHIFL